MHTFFLGKQKAKQNNQTKRRNRRELFYLLCLCQQVYNTENIPLNNQVETKEYFICCCCFVFFFIRALLCKYVVRRWYVRNVNGVEKVGKRHIILSTYIYIYYFCSVHWIWGQVVLGASYADAIHSLNRKVDLFCHKIWLISVYVCVKTKQQNTAHSSRKKSFSQTTTTMTTRNENEHIQQRLNNNKKRNRKCKKKQTTTTTIRHK